MKPHRLILAGFGAFAKRAEVDFDRLSEHGLYLIIVIASELLEP